MSAIHAHDRLLILGGGATCFSFGTFWSSSYEIVPQDADGRPKWHLATSKAADPIVAQSPKPQSSSYQPDTQNTPSNMLTKIPRARIQNATDFEAIRRQAQPVILEKLGIGRCTEHWTPDYLRDQVGADRKVVVHDSPTPHMNFQTKNFAYATKTFGELMDAAQEGKHVYLRALSAEKPADRATNLEDDFPTIASDFSIPPQLEYVRRNAHSSPLRVSGPVTMWLHYDVMANVLCQIRGPKRLLLYPPTDVAHLSFGPGASSSTINPFTASPSEHHGLLLTHPYEAQLNPGDILFIPPLWLHAAEPTEGLSIAVNVFFRDDTTEAASAYAAGKDVYGNRDLAMYERGRRDIQRIGKSFEGLPEQVRAFYVGRLAAELQSMVVTL